MAKFKGNFLRGIIARLIFKQSRKDQIITSKADNVKQTAATKLASDTFGLASTLCCLIRDILADELRLFKDGYLHSRLTGTLNVILSTCRDKVNNTFSFESDSFHLLAGMELNSNARLNKQLPGKLSVDIQDGLLNIGMPGGETARKLRFVKGSTACKMIFSVALIRLHEGLVNRRTIAQSVMISKNEPNLNGLGFSFEVPDDCLCLVTTTLQYYAGSLPIHDINLNCCAIIEAGYIQGTYDKTANFLWNQSDLIFKRAIYS